MSIDMNTRRARAEEGREMTTLIDVQSGDEIELTDATECVIARGYYARDIVTAHGTCLTVDVIRSWTGTDDLPIELEIRSRPSYEIKSASRDGNNRVWVRERGTDNFWLVSACE